jgi:hypothetical protein
MQKSIIIGEDGGLIRDTKYLKTVVIQAQENQFFRILFLATNELKISPR